MVNAVLGIATPHPLPLLARGRGAANVGGMRSWLLTDGKPGDEIPCLGLADAMGLAPERKIVRPRPFWAALAPWGPPDPADRGALTPPYPAIAFASGRRAVPYLRALKRVSPATFTVFLKDPRIGTKAADLIWVHEHDRLRGPNVIVSRTAPHSWSAERLQALRGNPDPRLAALHAPRVALLVGGRSRHHPFGQADQDAVLAIAKQILAEGASLAATISRRTPASLAASLRYFAKRNPRAFVWSGEGENPYGSLLATADAIVVTADSTNMLGEAVATGAPVHILRPTGGHERLDAFASGLVEDGAGRWWQGALDFRPTRSVDCTPAIAAEALRRFAAFQAAGLRVSA